MKKAVSLVLAVLLILTSLPMVALAGGTDASQNALYFKSTGTGPLMTRVSVVPGGTYVLSFNASNSFTNFAINGFSNDSHQAIDLSAEEDDSYSVDGKYVNYTYILTIPSTLATEQNSDKGFMFVGFTFPANTSGYIFNVGMYDEDGENIIANGTFDNLDHWAWDWDAWFEDYGYGEHGCGKTAWSNGATELRVMSIDDLFEMDEPAAPSRMIYYKNNESELLGSSFIAVADKTYYLSFGIATSADLSKIFVGAYGDGDRPFIDVSPKLISRTNHGNYSWVTYSVTMPSNLASLAMYNMVYIGVALPADVETYLFNMNIYDPYETEKTNLFKNKTFENIYNFSIGAWTLNVDTGLNPNGVFENNKEGWHSNDNNKVLRSMAYNASAFVGFRKMLNFEIKTDAKTLYSRINAEAEKTYNYSFSLSKNISAASFYIVTTTDEYRAPVNTTTTLLSTEEYDTYITYHYSIQMPDYIATPNVFIGLGFVRDTKGYLFNVTLTEQGDANAVNILPNGNFGAGLNDWACDWDAWFIQAVTGTGHTSWSNDNESLAVVSYDETVISSVLTKKMIHYYGTVSGSDKSLLAQKVNLEAGHTYAVEFLYGAEEGGLDLTCSLAIYTITMKDGKTCVGYPLDSTNMIKTTDGENGRLKYTFTVNETGAYALTFGSNDMVHRTDVYFGDFKIYDTADVQQANLLPMNDYTDYIGQWFAYYDASVPGSKSFNQQGYTIEMIEFDGTKFKPFEKQMLYFKETKKKGYDVFLQKITALEPNVEYTISMDYYFKSGQFNEAFYFGLFGGPGAGDMVYKNQHRSSKWSSLSPMFDTTVDTGRNIKYTFTLSRSEFEKDSTFLAGFYLLPDPDLITELYISNLTVYKTSDASKKNLFANDEYATTINSWFANYGGTIGNAMQFTRPDVEYEAYYMPLDEQYFPSEEESTHYGDANADGYFNVIDLIAAKKILNSAKPYFVLADMDSNRSVNADDIMTLRKLLLGSAERNWTDGKIALDTFNETGGADDAAATKKNTVCTEFSNVSVTGTTYYVSNDGNDSNNGKTPQTAIKTIDKVNQLSLNAGDAVLFRCGDTFRTGTCINLARNKAVTFSAYGTGAKPKIYGSVKNYANKSDWTSTDAKIWVTDISADYASNIIFNDGESVGFRKRTLAEVRENGDFYFDSAARKIYLFLNQINPAMNFNSIEISSSQFLFCGNGSNSSANYIKGVTISNLDLRYAATHAIEIRHAQNININYCSIGWSGGEYGSSNGDRFGNAIQFWREAKDCSVTNNYIYQAFDAAFTFQGTADNQYSGLNFSDNLVEYCSMNMEFWANGDSGIDTNARISNVDFTYNILRFSGFGFGGLQRDNKLNQGYILTWNAAFTQNQVSNVNVKNNIFDVANSYYFYAANTSDRLTFANNTYYQKAGSPIPFSTAFNDYPTNAAEFETAIKKIDANPASVQWVA